MRLGYLVIIYDTNKINYVQAEAGAMCVLEIVRFELSYVCCPHIICFPGYWIPEVHCMPAKVVKKLLPAYILLIRT